MRRRKMVTSRVNIENEHTSILISLLPEAKKSTSSTIRHLEWYLTLPLQTCRQAGICRFLPRRDDFGTRPE